MKRALATGLAIVTMVIILKAGCLRAQAQAPEPDKRTMDRSDREDPPQPSIVVDDARWKKAVDLLARIDLAKDVKGGKWEIKDAALVSGDRWGAQIKIPYQPPEEYDYRVSFTKLKPEGKLDGLNLWLPRSGRRHTVVAEVRKDSVTGYFDGKLLTKWKGDWKDLSFPDWVSRTQLEIATYSPTVFHSIELLEVTGKGTFTRGQVPSASDPAAGKGPERRQDVVVTIIYDNNLLEKRFETAWGFACVVEGLSETILFDTGGKGKLLLSNMAAAGFKPEQIDSIVLSHIHGDHTGGLHALLEVNNNVRVFVPKAFPAEFKEGVRQTGARLVETEAPQEVCPGAWTTGVLKQGLHEQGLYLEMSKGLVVITGCAHPGIVHMAKAASRHAKMSVQAVLGGFHMGGASPGEIEAVIQDLQEMGVQQVAPCHCSGDKTRQLMKKSFGEGYLPSGVGARLVFPQKREIEGR